MAAALRHCLLTISDDGFAAGTQMLIFSFLRSNPWFDGRIIVLLGGPLGAAWRARLTALWPVEFRAPGADLTARVAALADAIPQLRLAGPRFASLEAFGLAAFERVVYIDSDAFVTGDISALFTSNEALLCCGDGSHYDEQLGEGATARLANRRRYGREMSGCFNTGVLSLGPPLLDSAVRDELVAMIDTATWDGVETLGWTDQLILNRRFNGAATLLDGRYNYMPILEARIRRCDALTFADARIVHMAGRDKPWEDADAATRAARPPSLAKFHELWQQLAELLPGDAVGDTGGDVARQLADEAQQMRALMQPRTGAEAPP
jgi:Glycosyl transferase family 8